jgi:hypothetical protein
MALPNLTFSVASEYDGKGLGKARKDINSFDKSVKSLGRTLGATLSAAAVVQFGKASVRAFMDAEREGVALANTMKNLGLAFDTSRVTNYIDSVGKLYGVTGEQAVPAMQALLSATGSVTKSQQLFNTALNISAATGIDVAETAKGLSQAFLGNRKALSQYNTGLTKAELQLKSFDEIQQILDTRLKGAATDAAATYAGQLAILKENAEQAKEVIGKGLVDSFAVLAGDTGIGKATKAIGDFGQAISDTIYGLALVVAEVRKLDASISGGTLGRLIAWSIKYSPAGILRDLGAAQRVKPQPFTTPMSISGQNNKNSQSAIEKMRAKAEADALKRAKDLAAEQRKQLANAKKIAAEAAKKLALDKASAFLNKANQIFDMDRIQLAAAAMAKQTEEDRVRIRLKTEILDLEEAIAEGNVQGAAKFAAAITQDARLLGELRGTAFSLSDVPNPFAAWLASLEGALAALLALTNFTPTVVSKYTLSNPIANASLQQGLTAGLPLAEALSGARYAAQGAAAYEAANPGSKAFIPKLAEGGIVTNATMALIGEAGPEAVIPLNRMGSMGGTYVTVNISGSVTTERDLVDAITQGIYNNQASGIPINYSTVY